MIIHKLTSQMIFTTKSLSAQSLDLGARSSPLHFGEGQGVRTKNDYMDFSLIIASPSSSSATP